MKSISMSGTTMAGQMASANGLGIVRSRDLRESFQARWTQEAKDTGGTPRQDVSIVFAETRNATAKKTSAGFAAGVTPKRGPAWESTAQTRGPLPDDGISKGHTPLHATQGSAGKMKTLQEHLSVTTSASAAARSKKRSKGNCECPSLTHPDVRGESDALVNGEQASTLAKGSAVGRAERGSVPSSTKDPAFQLRVVDFHSISTDYGTLPNEMPVASRTEEALERQDVGMKDKTPAGSLNTTKPDKGLSSTLLAEAVLPDANGLPAGSANAAGTAATYQAGRPSPEGAVGAQLRLASVHGETAGVAPQIVAVTPGRLDVGVFNGTHGWLRVRAEMGATGAVTASVTAVDASHEALRSAVPEIARYLSGESVKVNSIQVHRFAETPGLPSGTGSGGQQSSGGQGNGREQDASPHSNGGIPNLVSGDSSPGTGSRRDMDGGLDDVRNGSKQLMALAPMWSGEGLGRGTWLNVCA